jgi:transcriptional regulator of arginine metabolism
MPSRAQRRQRILDLVAGRHPSTHRELRRLLAAQGIRTTQATLSRDLRDLGVAKGPAGYILPDNGQAHPAGEAALRRALADEMTSADGAAHTIVLRTRPGRANALAIEIDRAGLPAVLGTVAGDDTIIVVARSAARAAALLQRLRGLAGRH